MARNRQTKADDNESDYSQEVEEEEFPSASQESNSSDAPNLENMLTLIEQLKTSRVKKKRDAEKKFLQTAKGRISNEITEVVKGVTTATKSIDDVYTKFMGDYITLEDQIRKKWTEIQKEQANILSIVGKSIERHIEEGDKIEDQHIDGMASMKEACENMVTLIDSLAPQSL
ncbi:hypothetical protein PC9H_006297 [Pleurotus ostreatus]|uniref:Uncharacterized protein n=1 Tax=Pleurotus ostreatus TaxID=5322 RepID=A0A8H6ZTV0_PLEOS|nr:uncharacterized protein PC9H_006297 [Pleurotus ostreatus]KAF7430589.1 hypothetical protein PC9H_006297 [Pleurotus ostreatus]KAJ8694887.1 hypothetical protein PTI98_007526 [Pleurotus ostreatus]